MFSKQSFLVTRKNCYLATRAIRTKKKRSDKDNVFLPLYGVTVTATMISIVCVTYNTFVFIIEKLS